MKVETRKVIVFVEDNRKDKVFTDPAKAAEYWARIKEQEWIERHKDDVVFNAALTFIPTSMVYTRITNDLYDSARVRYRKLKRRSLKVFRNRLKINS